MGLLNLSCNLTRTIRINHLKLNSFLAWYPFLPLPPGFSLSTLINANEVPSKCLCFRRSLSRYPSKSLVSHIRRRRHPHEVETPFPSTKQMLMDSIQSLLNDPNNASPANVEAASLHRENLKEYVRRVRETVEESWECDGE